MSDVRVLAVVGNHRCTPGVITLLAGLKPHIDTIALDSGSELSAQECGYFTQCMPNVYYNGLLNAAYAHAQARRADVLLFICSDVSLHAPQEVASRLLTTFANPSVALYAPAMQDSDHRHMRYRSGGRLRQVSFVEGACFAVRVPLLASLCPVNLDINALGWGVDVHLGYLAWRKRQWAVVDDAVLAVHRGLRGYDTQQARAQRDAFYAQKERAARRFRLVASSPIAQTDWGWPWASALLRLTQRQA